MVYELYSIKLLLKKKKKERKDGLGYWFLNFDVHQNYLRIY